LVGNEKEVRDKYIIPFKKLNKSMLAFTHHH
jgi:hypothetical protein